MEEILINLMTAMCKSMTDETKRCCKKGRCDGQCPLFLTTLTELEEKKN